MNSLKYHHFYKLNHFSCIFLTFLFIGSSLSTPLSSGMMHSNETPQLIAAFENNMSIDPGEEYVIKYDPSTQSFIKVTEAKASSFDEKILQALVKAPTWLRSSLLYQFEHLDNPLPYAHLILDSERKFADELSFCIAHAPLGTLPDPEVLLENVEFIYEIDENILYADIIEVNQNNSDYYSTLQYRTVQDNESKSRIIPKEIYYWYVVHPQILSETPSMIYDNFWRSYLVNHNDIGYPLLLEKIKDIAYVWDGESYHQPKNRVWEESIHLHPTAVEAVSYWVGKTVPYQATGDRPGQPNLIAHQHNGWCGELQRVAVAALRSVLVPSISVCNIAEDHVWGAFYDNGWHQNDNWWTDSGGTVDVPLVYTDNWGKEMSSVFSWRGDGVIYDVTSKYLHANETVNVSFSVSDIRGHPLDGARVTVLVKGLKDITWYKNKALSFLESFWNGLPETVRDSFIDLFYTKLIHRIENISDVIDGLTISIWNYTDTNGECSFTLGKDDEYVFLIQQPVSSLPFPLASWTTLRLLKNPVDTEFTVRFPKIISEKSPFTVNQSQIKLSNETDKIKGFLSVQSNGFQYQANVRNGNIGQYSCECPISCMVLTPENYNNYVKNNKFHSDYFKKNININDTFFIEDDSFYIVFYNPSQHTVASINVEINLTHQTNGQNNIILFQPSTTIFQHPHFQVGDHIPITGISSDRTVITLNNLSKNLPSGKWKFSINTTNWKPGVYQLKATSGLTEINKKVTLIDNIPPKTIIKSPKPYTIINQGEQLIVHGITKDNSLVKSLFIGIDNASLKKVPYTTNWTSTINTALCKPGIHRITIQTIDHMENEQILQIPIVINDTIHSHEPIIHSINYSPNVVSNETSVIFYANISTEPSFPLKKIILEYKIETNPMISKALFEYANHPIQPRHPEDPRKNCSNHPIYGIELGRFKSNKMIHYRIVASDIARNKNISDWHILHVK